MVGQSYSLADDLARHAGLCGIDQRLPSENTHPDTELFLHEPTRLPASKAVTGYNRCGMYFILDEFVGTAKEFGSDNDNGSGSVPDLLVLFLGKVDKNSSSWMLNRQER